MVLLLTNTDIIVGHFPYKTMKSNFLLDKNDSMLKVYNLSIWNYVIRELEKWPQKIPVTIPEIYLGERSS